VRELDKEKELTRKELREMIERNVGYYIRQIDDVLTNIKQDVLREIECEGLDYKEGVFGTLADLVLIEVIKQLECYI